MKNKYEFKIEDINTVKVVSSSSDNFTTTYTRKNDRSFIITYTADVEESKTNKGELLVICNRCGAWNSLKEYDENNFICAHCYNLHEETISEENLIDTILSFLDEEIFFDISLYINDIQIQ